MKKRVVALLLCLVVSWVTAAQSSRIAWETLANVEWVEKYNAQYKQKFQYPVFSQSVKALDGKEVMIKGHLLPLDVGGKFLVLSRYPMESCFFCGLAGPESVLQVQMKNPFRIHRKTVTFKGRLHLNETDVDQLMYILENAELMPDVQ
ncbi:MAG: DUF3299 domain-containing protein [Bernardetiaceae bacterium]|jgi:hypothetical protein|nr:DUF3299 domain-containing protein [Bernardetiaceae bacterium]